ncbi:MAG: xanthan lyase, partial [Prevotella sp.]|nr:xanthan lyase [Prevotella sp.]
MYRLFLLLAISAISFIAQAQQPWVKNISRPYSIDHGLDGRHLSVWASHGRYYDNEKGYWKWQRPALFCTTEDLFTQTIVVPYLIPMLENAGAVVFTPRERDWQRNEVIVDNDDNNTLIQYQELNLKNPWSTGPQPGFAQHPGHYQDGENPFLAGTVRIAETTHNRSKASTVNYQPHIPEDGSYAVYVSYQTLPSSIDDAHYIVYHKGQKTEFHVNQQIGGSTWVYLGTFEFSEGCSDQNRVVVSNHSEQKGYVTTDAVRFGGGMGNIERGGDVSGLPRCLEGARYYAQWAGMPYEGYSSKQGTNDYGDDINVRSLMTNLLCGGSVYAPDSTGRKVPIELSLAVHSDAGHTDTGLGVYGSLTICTTRYGDSTLASGESREASNTLAAQLLENTTRDLQHKYGEWVARNFYDRNYSETRVPIVPSVILETMSHQNFGDMRLGQDPNFRFTLA